MRHETPAEFVAFTADLLLSVPRDDRDRAVAELLAYLAATWESLPEALRGHAIAVAMAHTTKPTDLPPRLQAALDRMAQRGRVVELTAPKGDGDPG